MGVMPLSATLHWGALLGDVDCNTLYHEISWYIMLLLKNANQLIFDLHLIRLN